MRYYNVMPSFNERSPQERETLMFTNKEKAQEFSERVAEKLQQEQAPGIRRDREVVAEAVAEELSSHGDPVGVIKEPWDHTPQEHEEVQQLINVAFSQDISMALKQLRKHNNYPRVLDLFHDVLTNEMYEAIKEHRLNEQSISHWGLYMFGVIVAALLIILVLLIV